MSAKIKNITQYKLAYKMCCVCLSSDRKLYNMKEEDLYKHYIDITDKNLSIDDSFSRIMCWECSARLKAAVRFKANALRSQTLIQQFLKTSSQKEIILDTSVIDRYRTNLKSTLIQKVLEPNHADYHFIHSEPVPQNMIEINIPIVKIEIDNNNAQNTLSDEDLAKTEVENNNIGKENNIEYAKKNKTEIIHENDNTLFDVKDETDTSSDETLIQVKVKKNKEKVIEKKIDRRKKPANEVLNTEIFDITVLSYEEQMNEIKKRQNSINFTKSELKCDKCFKGFVDEVAFKSHMSRHTDQGGPYQCNICEIRFKKTRALRNHVSSHMQKFSCKKCPYVTTRRHAAKMHEEYHNGTKYQCPHCYDEFSKKTTYMSHVRVKHPTDIVCELCGYSFVSDKGLIQHKKIKHRFDEHPVPLDGPECAECNVKFVHKEALERHLKLSPKHANDIINRKSTQPQIDYRERKRRSPNKVTDKKCIKSEKPMQCEQCDLQLPDSLSYYRHFRRSHPDKNRTNYPPLKGQSMCEVCGKMFQSLALLHDHSSTHSEGKQFACPLCGKRFQRKYRLIAHRRLHVRRQRHACPVCASVFTTASNMNRHIASHSGLKPYKCEICEKSFKLVSEKRAHINYVHLKEPWPKRPRAKRKLNKQIEPQSDDTMESTASSCVGDNYKLTPVLLQNRSTQIYSIYNQ